jgi:type III restriction enzyme
MADKFLYETLDSASELGLLKKEIPAHLKENLNPRFELRPYQEEAFVRFFYCLDNDFPGKDWPLHFLFNMATGSGKTLIMAGLILYLYDKGYRNFLFFVNSTNIIEKTRDNFLNHLSSKFLFVENIRFGTKRVSVLPVANFEGVNENDINICFTTIQKLHSDLTTEKENALTYEDFKDKKIVLLADEAHHMNTRTKAQKEMFESWENTVERIFKQNEDNCFWSLPPRWITRIPTLLINTKIKSCFVMICVSSEMTDIPRMFISFRRILTKKTVLFRRLSLASISRKWRRNTALT